jgi:transcriptional regulator with XRE-family HTH domain
VQQDVQAAGWAGDHVSLGGLVRAHRGRLRLTQEELAERAGLSERTLRNLEGDRIRRPYPDTIRRLADALELTGRHRDQFEAAARGATLGLRPEGMVPSLLPPSVTDFTGRDQEVANVLELLTIDGPEEAVHAVVVSAVAGKPGIGKTTWPSTSAIGYAASSRTVSCMSTCRAPRRAHWSRTRFWPGSSGPWGWTGAAFLTTSKSGPSAIGRWWPTGGCWWCWTTPPAKPRSGPCYQAARPAGCWLPVGPA